MKKLMLTVFGLGVLSFGAQAQKGSWYIGGNVGFNSSTQKSELGGISVDGAKVTNWGFAPEVGTFLTDNVQLGLAVNLNGAKRVYNNATKTEDMASKYGATVYGRYFFGKNSFRPFVGVNVSVLPGSMETTTQLPVATSNKFRTMDLGANLNAGFGYALSPRVTAVGSFGLLGFKSETQEHTTTNAKNTTSSFGLDAGTLGNRFTVGIYYTL